MDNFTPVSGFIDALLRPKVAVEEGSDIVKAEALHERAHNICVIGNSVNFPVRYEAEVRFTPTTDRPRTGVQIRPGSSSAPTYLRSF